MTDFRIAAPETWKPIPGFDRYEVSDQGRVRSWRVGGHPNHRASTPRLLKPFLQGRKRYPYLTVGLISDEGKVKARRVHVLVALAFLGPRPEGLDTRHLDSNPMNNRLDNLAYGTRLENARDAVENGSYARRPRKTHCKQGHPFSPENTKLNYRGYRECVTCYLASSRKQDERRRPLRKAARRAAA